MLKLIGRQRQNVKRRLQKGDICHLIAGAIEQVAKGATIRLHAALVCQKHVEKTMAVLFEDGKGTVLIGMFFDGKVSEGKVPLGFSVSHIASENGLSSKAIWHDNVVNTSRYNQYRGSILEKFADLDSNSVGASGK